MQMPSNGPISLDSHHGVDMHRAVDDLPAACHLRREQVVGDDVSSRIALWHGGNAEAVHRTDETDYRAIVDAETRDLFSCGLHQLTVTDLDDEHLRPSDHRTERLQHGG